MANSAVAARVLSRMACIGPQQEALTTKRMELTNCKEDGKWTFEVEVEGKLFDGKAKQVQ